MNKRPEESRSLLRRLLRQADQVQVQPTAPVAAPSVLLTTAEAPRVTTPSTGPTAASVPGTEPLKKPPTGSLVSPVTDKRSTGQMTVASPIRPPAPAPTPAIEPIQPSVPPSRTAQATGPAGKPATAPLIPTTISTPAERLQAENALEELRRKTAFVATEFAEGRINRAQFSSMYAYYNEKRIIIEQLLRCDPDTQAWQQVARSGHTTFLRQHFEARVLAFGVYDQGKFDPFISQGTMPLPREATQPILTALYVIQKTRKELSPISRKATNGHWLVIVPAVYTTALALFSLEPAAQQVLLVRDLHYDFERANRRVLERGVRQPDQLVFPHRALFEQHTDTGPLA